MVPMKADQMVVHLERTSEMMMAVLKAGGMELKKAVMTADRTVDSKAY